MSLKPGALALALAAGVAVGAAWVVGMRPEAEPPRRPAAGGAAVPRVPVPLPAAGPRAPAPPPEPTEIDPDRRRLAQPGGPGARGSLPERIEYPLVDKYAGQQLSRIPHRLIGAWDRAPREEARADLRVFVVVVGPETSDLDLERLLRDADARHRDAEHLRVQVFDSEAAARRPGWIDDGEAKAAHLVAELLRSPDPRIGIFRVRERRLER